MRYVALLLSPLCFQTAARVAHFSCGVQNLPEPFGLQFVVLHWNIIGFVRASPGFGKCFPLVLRKMMGRTGEKMARLKQSEHRCAQSMLGLMNVFRLALLVRSVIGLHCCYCCLHLPWCDAQLNSHAFSK